ncbi:MAG: acyl-CoA thioesterase [Akkermansia sp.]|nr:acyl-CoA thioesterase [Akkermansia sp.]
MKVTVYHQVSFYELDPMGVVWHGNYVNFFEKARAALIHKMGLSYQTMADMGHVWPVVKLRCKYMKSAVLNQKLSITAELKDYVNSLTIAFTIRDAETQEIITKGETMQMAVETSTEKTNLINPAYFIDIVNQALAAEKKD